MESVTGTCQVRRQTPLWPIGVAALAVAAVLLQTLGVETSDLDRLLLLNRHLARLSFLAFIPIYLATPLVRWLPGEPTRALVRIRRSLGLGYALIMGAHLLAIGAYQWTEGSESIDLATALGGGLGFFFIASMAATSNEAALRRLGARTWKRLHSSGLHWLWVIYAFTYLGRVAERGREFLPGLITVLALLAFRLSARFRPVG